MTPSDRDPVRALVEQARELRRREQPPPELFEAALARLIRQELGREELARERSGGFSLSRALNVVPRALFRLGPARLGLALLLALAVIVSWGARRQGALDPHQDVPTVALAAEPAPVHDATRPLDLGDHTEQPSAQQHPAPSARSESSGDKRKVAGFWTVESWTKELSPARPALHQMPDRRQCVDVSQNERLVLGWRSRGGPGRRGFDLVQGQRYRLILPHVSVTGPAQLELILIVGSSDGSHGPALVTHVLSVLTPSTVGFTFESSHDDDRAAVSLFVDAVGPSGASKLCLGAVHLDRQTEADAGAEPTSTVAAEDGKKKPAPKDSTGKPTDKPAVPPSCNPPWYIDAKGIKRLKPKCL